MTRDKSDIPDWLAATERYEPLPDRDGFIARSLLSVSSALALFRLDTGMSSAYAPSAPAKLIGTLVCILLVSLSQNYLFVLLMLAAILVRACLLPRAALGRLMGGAGAAASLSFLLMLPAALIGQPHAALLMATKTFVCVGMTLRMALTTPAFELTRALRTFGMPGIAIMTADLTLRSIVRLGETASEALCALRLRSVGRNPQKGSSIAGIGGVVLLKASRSAQETFDAMRCRGFDGEYRAGASSTLKAVDAFWLALLIAGIALFALTQGMV